MLSRVIEISKEVVMVANKAAEACPNRLPKQVHVYCLRIEHSYVLITFHAEVASKYHVMFE